MGRMHLLPPPQGQGKLEGRQARQLQIPPRKKVGSMDAATAAAAADEEEVELARMAAIADKLQNRDAVRLYNWVSQRCFSDCVVTFYRKKLGKGEADCVRACVRKYLHLTTATAARFADLAGTGSSAADEEA